MANSNFKFGELVLVDVINEITYEQWVPAVYLGDAGRDDLHFVELDVDGERKQLAFRSSCIKHSSEAIKFKVRYEVYVDRYDSACEYHDTIEKAREDAQNIANQKAYFHSVTEPIYIDKVLVGGTHPYEKYEPKLVEEKK